MGLFKPHKPSDYPSLLLYVLDETHLTLTALNAAILLWSRDAHVLWFSAGALISSLSAKGIKHFIRSPRPPPPPPTSGKDLKSHVRPKKTFGMPSTHSTALSFYFFYLVPVLLLPPSFMTFFPFALPLRISLPLGLKRYNPDAASFRPRLRAGGAFRSVPSHSTSRKLNLSDPQSRLSAFCITMYWIGGVWSRVELGYHTYPQVWAGVAFGWFISTIWRGVWLYNPGLEGWMQGWIDRIWGLGLELVSWT